MLAITIQKYRKNVSLEVAKIRLFLNLFLQAIILHSKETVLIKYQLMIYLNDIDFCAKSTESNK